MNSTDPAVGVCDSDGEVKGQESTLFAIFEFIGALSESSFSKRLLPPILPELVYHLIGYMQITEEQVCVCVCVCVHVLFTCHGLLSHLHTLTDVCVE